MSSDNVLSRNEKPDVVRDYAAIAGEYAGISAQALAIGATAQRTAYVNAYTALTSYLTGLSPAYTDTTQDTVIVGTTFNDRFRDYYVTRSAVQMALVGIVAADATAALAQLATIASDSVLSAGEKPQVIREWSAIEAEYPGLSARALAVGATVQRNALIAAYTALGPSYLFGLSPAWNDTTQNTTIVPATFNARFTAWHAAKQAVMDAMIGIVGADASAALARIAAILSDSTLSANEKPEIVRQWAAIEAEYPNLSAQALAIGATSQRSALIAAYNALGPSYLFGLSPAWNDTSQDTPIVPATFEARFTAWFAAKQAVTSAMIGIVGADAQAALAALSAAASDNVLTRGEKPQAVREYTELNAEASTLVTQATALGLSSSAWTTAINALSSYLGGLSPGWSNTAFDTPIDGDTFTARFSDAYAARAALRSAIAARIADGVNALARIAAIANDNILAREEKSDVIAKYTEYAAEYVNLSAAALAAGVTTQRSAYIAAFDALTNHLAGLSPPWYDTGSDTPISGSVFNAKFTDYVAARAVLQAALAEVDRNTGARVPISRSVAYPITTLSTSQIDVAAHSVVLARGEVVSIPSGSLTGLSTGTVYGVFYRAGEGLSAEAEPALTRMSTGSRIFLGWQATQVSGGGYPTGPIRPGGSGGGGGSYEPPPEDPA